MVVVIGTKIHYYLEITEKLEFYAQEGDVSRPLPPFGAKALNGSLGPGTQDPNEGTQMLGPKYWDPNSEVRNVRVPSAGTHRPGTQMKRPR